MEPVGISVSELLFCAPFNVQLGFWQYGLRIQRIGTCPQNLGLVERARERFPMERRPLPM